MLVHKEFERLLHNNYLLPPTLEHSEGVGKRAKQRVVPEGPRPVAAED